MKIPEPELQQHINKLLQDLDLPDLYKKYNWKGDRYANGFPDLLRLEKDISEAAKNNTLGQQHLVEIAKWGKLRNTKGISFKEPLGPLLYIQKQSAPNLNTEPDKIIEEIDATICGFGPTYSSKLLHFAVPQIFGALDSRLVRIFGNSAPVYHLLNLDATKSGDRWLISPDQSGWPGEYGTWTRILNYLADRLNKTGKSCPHPEKYYQEGLRQRGIWLPADVETALFSYASQQISSSVSELEILIGYIFQDKNILEEARTRRANLNEKTIQDNECMDPLATLGDAVLDTIVIFKLYEEGVKEKGELTKNKIDLVKRKQTRAFADQHKLGEYVHWGIGEDKDEIWDKSDKALDAVTEALIGAVFLDAQKRGWNGMNVVMQMLELLKYF